MAPKTVSTQYAGFISRAIAFVLDLIVIGIATFLVTAVIGVIAQFFDLGLTQITLDDQTTVTPLQILVTLAAGLLQTFFGLVYFLFFWVLGIKKARAEVNLGSVKPVGTWWEPVAKYLFVGVAVLIIGLSMAFRIG